MQRWSSAYDISWFLDTRRHGQLNLDPPYQRKSVWTKKDQLFFLDTIFRGYPSPPIFLHKTMDDKEQTVYAVVDGKQRLLTIFLFADGKLAISPDFGDDRFNGKTIKQLGESEKRLFWDYRLPIEQLTFDLSDTKAVNVAFDRLNRNMRKLEPQELRHARWGGWFITLVEGECDDPTWRDLGVVTNARSKRMKDAQFISELVMVLIDKGQHGFDQDNLDNFYARYDDPEDSEVDFDTEEVNEALKTAKAFLSEMQAANGSVKTHARTVSVFYTLWALVALHKSSLPDAKEMARIFDEFMKKVNALDPKQGASVQDVGSVHEWKFLLASKGAHTDLAPRKDRLEALLSYVLDQ